MGTARMHGGDFRESTEGISMILWYMGHNVRSRIASEGDVMAWVKKTFGTQTRPHPDITKEWFAM